MSLSSDRQFSTIQYKTGITVSQTTASNSIDFIDKLLTIETKSNKSDSWTKLDKTTRILKLKLFVETILGPRNNLSSFEKEQCTKYLVKNINKGIRLSKDVVYDIENCIITDIPALEFVNMSRVFTLRKTELSESSGKTRRKKTNLSINDIDKPNTSPIRSKRGVIKNKVTTNSVVCE